MRALIEAAGIDDLAEAASLWEQGMAYHARRVPFFRPAAAGATAWRVHVATCLAKGEGMVFLARSGEGAAGFIFGQIHSLAPIFVPGRLGYVSDLYVREDHRRHGLGRLLFLALRDWFYARGVTDLDLQAYLANPGAGAFWREMGFSAYAERMRLEMPAPDA